MYLILRAKEKIYIINVERSMLFKLWFNFVKTHFFWWKYFSKGKRNKTNEYWWETSLTCDGCYSYFHKFIKFQVVFLVLLTVDKYQAWYPLGFFASSVNSVITIWHNATLFIKLYNFTDSNQISMNIVQIFNNCLWNNSFFLHLQYYISIFFKKMLSLFLRFNCMSARFACQILSISFGAVQAYLIFLTTRLCNSLVNVLFCLTFTASFPLFYMSNNNNW